MPTTDDRERAPEAREECKHGVPLGYDCGLCDLGSGFETGDSRDVWDAASVAALRAVAAHPALGTPQRAIIDAAADRILALLAPADAPAVEGEREASTTAEPLYACTDCGKLRTKAEGGTTFTICDECWGALVLRAPTAPAPEGRGEREGLRERIAALKESGNGYCVDPHWDRYYDGWNAAIDAVLDELLAPGHTDLMVSPEAIDAALTQDMSARQNHEAPTIHPDWMEVGMELCINPDGEVVLFEGGAFFDGQSWQSVDDGDGLLSMTLGQVQPVSVELARQLQFRQAPPEKDPA